MADYNPNQQQASTGGSGGGGNKSSSTGGNGGGNKGSSTGGNGQAAGGNKGSSGFQSGTEGYQPGGGFWDFQARPIAGSNPLQDAAAAGSFGMFNAGQGGLNGAYDMLSNIPGIANSLGNRSGLTDESMGLFRGLTERGDRKVDGSTIMNDPALKEALSAFDQYTAPGIQDAAGLMGLGRSGTAANALATQKGQVMLPLIQDAMGREERSIDRGINATGAAASGLFQGGAQDLQRTLSQAGLYGNAASQYSGLAGQEQGMLQNAINSVSQQGGTQRGIEQEQLNAPYDEQQRLYAEALNSLYGPFGMVPSVFGSSSEGGGKK